MIAIYTQMRSSVQQESSNVLVAFGASLLLALFAFVKIPLPFSPVPIAFQPHLALFLSLFLGGRRGTLAVIFFLLEGALGFPVFAGGGSGLFYLLGPTGGYLMGTVIASWIVGSLSQSREELTIFRNMILGSLIIYPFGWAYLSTFVGSKNALLLGVVPFILGDLLKCMVFTKLLRRLTP